MKKLILGLIVVFSAVSLLAFVAAPPLLAQVDPKAEVCKGVSLTGGSCTATSGPSVQSVITDVINILSFAVGVIAIIMIIIGGIKYITANGDAGGVSSAKQTILGAIIGLVIVAMAQVIVRFVITSVTS